MVSLITAESNIVKLTVISSSGRRASPVPEGDRAMGWAIDDEREVSTMPCTMTVAATIGSCLPDEGDGSSVGTCCGTSRTSPGDELERRAGEAVMVE